ncbi:hypothetical protein LWI29_014365 [Acer saccharum]|uniref:Uncharacterized protein n=1 Tax=Acer saccharum TaxID=4024 RepID=A0AA39W2G8_ACESA|nr:hypothetical protein LWI29_014365 [Acer saccharum]
MVHPMMTRSRDVTRKPLVPYTGLSTQHPLPTCLHTVIQNLDVEPTCYTEASKFPHWQAAMLDEFNALLKQHSWSLVLASEAAILKRRHEEQPVTPDPPLTTDLPAMPTAPQSAVRAESSADSEQTLSGNDGRAKADAHYQGMMGEQKPMFEPEAGAIARAGARVGAIANGGEE